jgi:hypothetical protein
LIEGNVTTSNNVNSAIQEIKSQCSNHVANEITIQTGKTKIGTNYIPIQMGKTMAMVPNNYKYIDWNTVELQEKSPKNTLCGNWCLMRLLFHEKHPEIITSENIGEYKRLRRDVWTY